MPPLPRTALVRLVLASLMLAAFAPSANACNPPKDFARCLREIEADDSLTTANSLLDSQAIQSDWKSEDPEGYRRAFAAATELKDVAGLLMGLSEPRAIRLGLENRPLCEFCQDPVRFEAWFKKEIPRADKSRVKALREAMWAWEAVPAAAKAAMAVDPVKEKDWETMTFKARMSRLRLWAQAESAGLLATTPRTQSELEAFEARARAVGGILGNSDSHRIWERFHHARQAVAGLERAEKLVGNDPVKRKALADARGADLDGMLAGLGAIFDGAGVKDPAFRAAAPATAEQTFDDARRRRVAALLATRLMKETEGTYAGADLAAFYGEPKTPYNALDLRVAPPMKGQENWIGWHSEGVITFNEKHLVEYLKAEGRAIDDLATDDELLGRLSRQLVPLFVHEATHQVQYAWRKEKDLPWLGGQVLELETMQTEALFIIEKSRRDPKFKEQLEREYASSSLARESVSKAERLKSGTGYFRDTINAWHYPELLSLDGTAWCRIAWHNGMAKNMEAELARRDALSSDEKAVLEAGPAMPERLASEEEWKTAVRAAGTPHIRNILAAQRGDADKIPAAYSAYGDRLDQVNARTEDRLKLVLENKLQTWMRKRREPPSPK